MARLYQNFISGTSTTDPLLIGGTTLDGAFLADVPVVSSPDVLTLVLDPEGSGNGPEAVHITNHSVSATTCTISRAQEGTSAAEHASGTKVIHPVTEEDLQALITATAAAQSDADSVRSDFDSHELVGGTVHAAATTGTMGFMSATDKVKLNTIETSAKNDQTITAGTGLTGGGTGDVTISHYNTSSVGNIDCQADEHINVLGFDTYGHTITATKQTMSAADIGAAASSHTHSGYDTKYTYANRTDNINIGTGAYVLQAPSFAMPVAGLIKLEWQAVIERTNGGDDDAILTITPRDDGSNMSSWGFGYIHYLGRLIPAIGEKILISGSTYKYVSGADTSVYSIYMSKTGVAAFSVDRGNLIVTGIPA